MKKTIVIGTIVLIVCLLSATVLSACGDGLSAVELSAKGKNDSIVMLSSFFNDTIEKANTVVTVKSGEKIEYTESIDGTKSCVRFAADNSSAYSFIRDDEYITAFPSGAGSYYLTGKNWYDKYYCYFSDFIDTMAMISEEDGTFGCVSQASGGFGTLEKKNASLTFNYVSDARTVKIKAKNKDGLAQSVVIDCFDKTNGSSTTTMTFKYDSATVTTPDISDWSSCDQEEQDSEPEEINKTTLGEDAFSALNRFMRGTFSEPDLVATVKVDGEEKLVETISQGVDLVEYATGEKTYAFAKRGENGAGVTYYYASEYGAWKTYKTDSTPFYEALFYTDYVLKDILEDGSDCSCRIEEVTETDEDKQEEKKKLIFRCSVDGKNTVLVAISKNGLVRKIIVTQGCRKASTVTNVIIRYKVSKNLERPDPESDGWIKLDNEEE